jgi:hypothetical protein
MMVRLTHCVFNKNVTVTVFPEPLEYVILDKKCVSWGLH